MQVWEGGKIFQLDSCLTSTRFFFYLGFCQIKVCDVEKQSRFKSMLRKWEKLLSPGQLRRMEFLSVGVRTLALTSEKFHLNEVSKWEQLLTNGSFISSALPPLHLLQLQMLFRRIRRAQHFEKFHRIENSCVLL